MSRDPKITTLLVAILLCGMATVFYTGWSGPGRLGGPPLRARSGPPAPPFSAPGLSVFFTDPGLEGYRGGPETGLLAAVDAARATIDIAAYDLDLWGLRDALLAAHRRGVRVRMVVEAENRDAPEVAALEAAGIPVASDLPDALMHDKFVIIDRAAVWTGSMNFTLNDAYRNDNRLIRLASAAAAEAYQAEFEEMFSAGLYGAFSPPGLAQAFTVVGPGGRTVPVEVWFAPDDRPLARILELIEAAQTEIRFLAFSFTADAIGQALLDRAAAGVLVQGVFDESQLRSSGGSEYDYLLAAGLDVRIDGNPNKLHHKLIIIDRRIVIAGSYNFSLSAESRNDENLIVLFDPDVAAAFLVEWARVFEIGR